MPRNASGTMTLPSGNPVVTDTIIDPTWANGTLGDISTEISDSLSRSGKGAMTAPLRVPDGTVAAPALSFSGETGSGWFRNAANDIRLAVGAALRAAINAAGHAWTAATADGASAVAFTFDTTNALANATAKLISVKNGGSEQASIDYAGNLTLGGYARGGGAFVAAGFVTGASGTINSQSGSVTASCTRNAAGNYTITVAGLTTTAIISVTVLAGISTQQVMGIAPGSGSFNVRNTAAATDLDFSFTVYKL